MDDLISRQAAIDAINRYCSVWMEYTEVMSIHEIAERALKASKQSMTKILHDLPSAEPEIKPIEYRDCANAMMKMWIDGVLTDGEYNRIMDKLNAHWRKKNG